QGLLVQSAARRDLGEAIVLALEAVLLRPGPLDPFLGERQLGFRLLDQFFLLLPFHLPFPDVELGRDLAPLLLSDAVAIDRADRAGDAHDQRRLLVCLDMGRLLDAPLERLALGLDRAEARRGVLALAALRLRRLAATAGDGAEGGEADEADEAEHQTTT